jgi:hypothetical protein
MVLVMKNKFICCLLLVVSLSARLSFGQGTFEAIASGSWNTSGSWSLTGGTDADGIPDADDTAIIPNTFTISLTADAQIASLTIQNGGTLVMNINNADLDIVANGGLLSVESGGVISNPIIDNNQINFLDNSTFIINGTIQTDLLEFEGLNQTVTITGGGTLLVGGFGVNNSGVTINLNTTGSFGSNLYDFLVDQPNFTINGTGTIEIAGDQDLVLSSIGTSIGCHMNINVDGTDADPDADGDLEITAVGSSLTITNGGVVTTGDDVRVGGELSANNSTITVDFGGELIVGDDINFNNNGGSADGCILTNNGTVSVTELLEFNNETFIAITNNNLFTVSGNITSVAFGSSVSFTNAANATFNVGGNIDVDMILNFTANGNTVDYFNNLGIAQNIATTTYYNLTLSNTGSKRALGNFALLGNWTRSGTATFNPGSFTVTFSALAGTAAQTITAIGGETFYNLTMNSAVATSPQIILNNPVTVSNSLNLTSGVINLNGNTFSLGVGTGASVLSRTAGWMYGGSFRRIWRNGQTPSPTLGNLYGLFPLGNSSSYRPVEITANASITITGSVSFNHIDDTTVTNLTPFYDDDPTAGVIDIVRKHNAQFIGTVSGVAVGVGTRFTIRVTMTELLAGTASDIRLAVSNGVTTVTNYGVHVANSGTATNPVVGRNNLNLGELTNDFRITTINSVDTPLPIELISFKGEVEEDAVKLNWETASELNNDFFTVERSTGGEVFSSIGKINGAGTTNQGRTYSLIDHNPIYGTDYYRLKQTDFDGTFTYSKIIPITFEGSTVPVMDVYPNPSAGDQFNIKISGLKDFESVPVVLYDQMGREYMNFLLIVDKSSGTASKTFTPLQQLTQGVYVLKAGASPMLTKRFVVTSK